MSNFIQITTVALFELNTLKSLDFNKQLAFAYLTCERLFPNYAYFSKHYKFGQPNELRIIIDYFNNNLFNDKPDKTEINSLIGKIEILCPRPAEFETVLASSALDACGVIYESLNFMIDKKNTRLDDISTMATDSVYMYIQELDNLNFNDDKMAAYKILNHPLMIKEISVQKGIISYLERIHNIQSADIITLMQLQKNNKSNLGL